MASKKSLKIGIVVGLKSEERSIPKNNNIFVARGYGQEAYKAAKKVLKNNIDLIISFGLAGGMNPKIKNSEIIIPKKIFNEKFKFHKTSYFFNSYLEKKCKEKVISKVNLITSQKILNKKMNTSLIDAVDMEADFVFKAAREHNVPFSSVKVIFDDLKNPIPNFLISTINTKGQLKALNLFFLILKKPYRIKNLIEINKIYRKSMRKLTSLAQKLFL